MCGCSAESEWWRAAGNQSTAGKSRWWWTAIEARKTRGRCAAIRDREIQEAAIQGDHRIPGTRVSRRVFIHRRSRASHLTPANRLMEGNRLASIRHLSRASPGRQVFLSAAVASAGQLPTGEATVLWCPNDRDYLRRYYYRNLGYINRGHRPIFIIGGYIPYGYRGYFTPLPPHLIGYFPPPPPGYVFGYFQGYVVLYNPATYSILNFVDLLD